MGLAAIGRPAYITANRAADFGHDRSEVAFRERTWQLLDAAYAAGVRYVDVARSYGLAEQFLSQWLADRGAVDDLVIGSKWGYTYVGGWDLTAPVQEVKDLSLATFERQYAENSRTAGRPPSPLPGALAHDRVRGAGERTAACCACALPA